MNGSKKKTSVCRGGREREREREREPMMRPNVEGMREIGKKMLLARDDEIQRGEELLVRERVQD